MMKFNRDQIIKALEHHTKPIVSSCEGCSYMGVSEFDEDNFCTDYLIKDALALIKELTEELEKERTWADSMIDNLRDDIKELTEECKDFKIRALRAENEAAKYKDRWETSEKDFKRLADNASEINQLIEKLIPEVKADTMRKMQNRLEERIDQTIQVFDFQISECNAIRQALRGVKNDIYQIAKEMLEENNV